jgi:hypothetical protein
MRRRLAQGASALAPERRTSVIQALLVVQLQWPLVPRASSHTQSSRLSRTDGIFNGPSLQSQPQVLLAHLVAHQQTWPPEPSPVASTPPHLRSLSTIQRSRWTCSPTNSTFSGWRKLASKACSYKAVRARQSHLPSRKRYKSVLLAIQLPKSPNNLPHCTDHQGHARRLGCQWLRSRPGYRRCRRAKCTRGDLLGL